MSVIAVLILHPKQHDLASDLASIWICTHAVVATSIFRVNTLEQINGGFASKHAFNVRLERIRNGKRMVERLEEEYHLDQLAGVAGVGSDIVVAYRELFVDSDQI